MRKYNFGEFLKITKKNLDSLRISEEHQSRALAPVGSYYFYFDHEELVNSTMCGIELPKAIDTQTNSNLTFKFKLSYLSLYF